MAKGFFWVCFSFFISSYLAEKHGSLLGRQAGLPATQPFRALKAKIIALTLPELLDLALLCYIVPKEEMSRVPLSMGCEHVPEALK